MTAKERAWRGMNDIANPVHKADVREYVLYLERTLMEVRVERNYLRNLHKGKR